MDFEAVDKEIEEDKAAQTAASIGAEPSQVNKDNDTAPQAWTYCFLPKFLFFFFFFFFDICLKVTEQLVLDALPVFGAFCEQFSFI